MRDAELQRLERAVRATGSPEARIRYVRALERIGQHERALESLWPGLTDPNVQSVLASYRASTQHWGGPGGTFVLDVPFLDEPELRWCKRYFPVDDFGGYTRYDHPVRLLAHPLGVLFEAQGEVLVLWPHTGEARFTLPGRLLAVIDDVVLVHDPGVESRPLVAYDVSDGARLWRAPGPTVQDVQTHWLDGFLAWKEGGGVRVVRLDDPRQPPSEPLFPDLQAFNPDLAMVRTARGHRFVVAGWRDISTFDEGGRLLWVVPIHEALENGIAADERGVVALWGGNAKGLSWDGEILWEAPGDKIVALYPDVFVAAKEGSVVEIDRATGASRTIDHAPPIWMERYVAGGAYFATDEPETQLVACDEEHVIQWAMALPELKTPTRMAFVERWLFLADGSGSLAAIGPAVDEE